MCAEPLPGSVRELRNILKRALALSGGNQSLSATHLGLDAGARVSAPPPKTLASSVSISFPRDIVALSEKIWRAGHVVEPAAESRYEARACIRAELIRLRMLFPLEAWLAMLESMWKSLTGQRLEQVENKYEKDTWRLSKLLCRSGFLAARYAMPADAMVAARLWKMSMAMAITAWLSSTSTDSFSEVHYGLCHLAAGPIEASEEPEQTLSYLRGEADLLARAAIDSKSNGWDPAKVARACAAAGIDVVLYLRVARNAAQLENFAAQLGEFRVAVDDNRTTGVESNDKLPT